MNQLMNIVPNEVSDLFKMQLEHANKKKILVVHRRLGDYAQDDAFGVLPDTYYQVAIKKSLEIEAVDEIWLFTDTPGTGIPLPSELGSEIPIRAMPQELSSAETLELMRYGSSFVIANSTFSWWGAFLSYANSPSVIAPAKWFKGMEDPRDICPPNWVRVTSW
jgi:hypothetical protein